MKMLFWTKYCVNVVLFLFANVSEPTVATHSNVFIIRLWIASKAFSVAPMAEFYVQKWRLAFESDIHIILLLVINTIDILYKIDDNRLYRSYWTMARMVSSRNTINLEFLAIPIFSPFALSQQVSQSILKMGRITR